MSLHRSLKRKDALVRQRNVLSRAERVERLQADEKWEDGMSVLGLPKVKPLVIAAPSKAKAEEPAEETEGTDAAEASDQ